MAKIKALILSFLGKSKSWQLNIFNPFTINFTFNFNTLLYAYWLISGKCSDFIPSKNKFSGGTKWKNWPEVGWQIIVEYWK